MKKTFKTLVEVSARHIHLNQTAVKKLFGANYDLKTHKIISQPNQFAAAETVKVIGPKGSFKRVRVVGPIRPRTQLEISVTDSYILGIQPQVRVSGDLKGTTGGVKIVGPRGSLNMRDGVIIAQRHLHLQPELAKKYGLKHRSKVSVQLGGKRSVTFHQVVVRSRPGIDKLSFQIDTDEGNAAGIAGRAYGQVIIEK